MSTLSIVEALAGKDFKIDNKPNTRITPEMYAVLETIYGEDKARNIDHEKAREQYEEKRSTIKSSRQESVSIDSFLQPIDDAPKKEKPFTPPVPDSLGLEPLDVPAKKEQTPETSAGPADKAAITPDKREETAPKPAQKETKPAAESKPEKEKTKPVSEPEGDVRKESEPVMGKKAEDVSGADLSDTDTDEEDDSAEESGVIRARSERLKGTRVLGRISIEKDVPADDKAPGKGRKKRKKKVGGKSDETAVPGAASKPAAKAPAKADSE
ncbi:MAG: hypothetical protein LC662_02950, partial [Rhodothermaceae bacterium]|nr:hypothetical protein [Rhodothermaceae bacterium]